MIIYLSYIGTKHLSMNSLILGIRNKMEFSRFFTIYTSLPVKGNTTTSLVSFSPFVPTDKLMKRVRNFSTKVNANKLNDNEEFLFWFSGFTDGEGNFSIFLDKAYIRFRFKINLHIDDIQVLKTIQSKLNIGKIVIEENKNSCAFVVQSFSELKDVLCPIFNQFPLHTTKKLDFQDFYSAILIKANSNNGKLSDSDKEKILSIKDGMNLGRIVFKFETIGPQITINPNWLIGFIEAEGTFGIKTGSSLYFQIAQKTTSQESLNAITTFLIGLSNLDIPKDSEILPVNVTNVINIRTNVVSLVVSSVDALYYHILPWLDSSNMYTRKFVDFKLWKIALLLKVKGYYYLTEGKNLFLDISDVLNKRYSTNNNLVDINKAVACAENIYERFENISKIESPFNVKLFIPHVNNARMYRIANKSDKPRIVYLYTNEGLVEGSPFASYSLAHKTLGLKSSSNTCNRYIDTGRLYKDKYIFTSKPIDSASRIKVK